MAVSKKQEEVYLCDGHNSEFLKCSGQRKSSDFYNVWSIFKGNGKSHYCKDCVGKIFNNYLSLGSLQSAMYYTCQVIDVPFIAEIYEKINQKAIDDLKSNNKKTINYFGNYIAELQKYTTKKEIWNNFSCTDVDLADIDSRIKTREVKQKEIERFELDWGKQSEIEDYIFLEYVYDELTQDKTLTKPQEMLYRDLCLARLTKRKIDGNEIKDGDISKVQKQILDLMNKLKIDNFSEEKEKDEYQLIWERQIWEIENKKPCEVVDLETYKDLCDIEKKWGKEILRSVRNLIAKTKDYPDIEKF